MPRRILDQTNNLLALYQYHVGESQIPMDYHIWCCLSGVAACLADRVWYQKFKWAKTTPALFTFLIGPSAVGKGEAIDVITRYLDTIPAVNQYVGDITPEAMLELMGGPKIKGKAVGGDKSKFFLVTEELAGSIGGGPQAQQFIRKLTQLWKRGSTKFRHTTVAGANAVVENHCVPGDAQVLTQNGWRHFDSLGSTLSERPTIMQWSVDGTLSWCKAPVAKFPFKGELIRWSEEMHDCAYTPEHRLVLTSKNGIRVREAKQAAVLQEFTIPLSGMYSGSQSCPFIRLVVAIQADAHIQNRRAYFGLRKRRKIRRLRSLCKQLDVVLEKQKCGVFCISGPLVVESIRLLGKPKRLGSWLLQYDGETLDAFLDEVVWWDGHESRAGGARSGYSAVPKVNAIWVATIAHLRGKSAYLKKRPTAWYVTIRDRARTSLYHRHQSYEQHNGNVYCVTTQTGYFLCKRNDKVFVTGNSINWLAGSTIEWMVDAIPPTAIKGGFIGRIIPVIADYDFSHRVLDPTHPWDYDEVEDHIRKRFAALTRLEGEFRMTKLAKRIRSAWFHNRPEPSEQLLYPTWLRQDDLSIKMAQNFSACESHDLVIRARHMEMSLKVIAGSYRAVRMIVHASSQTGDTRSVDIISQVIRRVGVIRESALAQRALNEGVGRRSTFEALQTLLMMKRISRVRYTNKKGKLLDTAYEWQQRGML